MYVALTFELGYLDSDFRVQCMESFFKLLVTKDLPNRIKYSETLLEYFLFTFSPIGRMSCTKFRKTYSHFYYFLNNLNLIVSILYYVVILKCVIYFSLIKIKLKKE